MLYTALVLLYFPASLAGMAELVDAPDSKSGSSGVGVRLPLPAPNCLRKIVLMKSSAATLPAAILVAAFFGAINAASAAQCVTVKLIDKAGVVVPTPAPIIGIMVGGKPAIEASLPTEVFVQPATPAPCPAALVKSMQDLFEESCPTEEKRKRAAAVNKVDTAIIEKGCRDTLEALK